MISLETLSETVFKEFDLWILVEADWSLYLQFFKIFSGSSTGDLGLGSGLLLVYLLLLEARISQWSFSKYQWSHQVKNNNLLCPIVVHHQQSNQNFVVLCGDNITLVPRQRRQDVIAWILVVVVSAKWTQGNLQTRL